jgi:hypothetical protein
MSTIEPLPDRTLAQANTEACAQERAADGGGRRMRGGGELDGRARSGCRIAGITRDGKPFRPGDWAERLAGVIALFVKEKRPGSSVAATWLAVPLVEGGVRCLSVSPRLADVCPEALEFVMRFADDNGLVVRADGDAASSAD